MMSSARSRVVRSSTQRAPSETWSDAIGNGSGDASATTLQRTRWNSARRAPVNGCGPIPIAIAKISRCTSSGNGNMMKLTVSVDSGRRDIRLGGGRRTARVHDGGPNSAGEEYDTPSSASSSPAAAAANTVPTTTKGTTRAHRPCPPLPPQQNLKHRPSVDSDADSGIGHHRVSTSSSEGDHPLKRAPVSNMEWVPIRGPSGCLGIHRASAVRNIQPSEHWRPAKIPPPPKDYMLPPSLAIRRTADESRFARWSVTGAASSASCPKSGDMAAAKKRWSAPAIGRLSVSSMYANVYENTLPKDKELEFRSRPRPDPVEAVLNPNAVNVKALPARCPKAMCKSLASLLSVEDMPSVHARPVAVVPANDSEIQRDNYENVDDEKTPPPRVQCPPAEVLRSEAEYARVNKPRGVVRKTVKSHPGDEQEPPLPPRNYRSGTPVRRSQSLSRRSIASRVQVLTRTAKMALRKAFSLDALGSATALKKDSSSASTPPSNSRSFF